MKTLYLIAGLLCSSLLIAGCNASGDKEDNQNSSVKSTEQVEETPDEENVVTEVSERAANTSESFKTKKDNEPFAYLEKLILDFNEEIVVKYPSSSTVLFNKTISDLDVDDPFYYGDGGPWMSAVKVLKTKIAASGPDYYVVFDMGPSADPSFRIYEDGSFENSVFSATGTHLYIPGNGNIYIAGHTNNMFNTRKKIKVSNGNFIETEQPYYYVGLKTRTLKPGKLYKTESLSSVVASFPKDYSVEVLINKPNTNLFLLRTEFGLTGWLEIPGESMFYGNEMIEGIYYAGD